MKATEFLDATKIALIVGTALCIINQMDVIIEGDLEPKDILRICLNYLVPFLVASYSKFQMHRKAE